MKQQQIDNFLKDSEQFLQDGCLRDKDRRLTLYVAHDGVGLTVSQVVQVNREGSDQLIARTHKGQTYYLSVEDVFALTIDAPKDEERKAGFSTNG